MPRPKSEFKPLTAKSIIEKNPDRKNLSESKKSFKRLLVVSTKIEPFDKKAEAS